MEPEISIVVPIYKAEKYLERCVDSILGQTFTNFELILVDDGSPDRCPEICDAYAQRDQRVRVLHKPNGGEVSARCHGTQAARGEYVGFVDSDDYVHPEMYQFLYDLAKREQADVSICGFEGVDDHGVRASLATGQKITCNGRQAIHHLLKDNLLWMVVWNKLYRRSLFEHENLDRGLKCSGDAMTNYYLLRKANRVALHDVAQYCYYQNLESALRQAYQPYHILDNLRYIDTVREEEGDSSDLLPEIQRSKVVRYITQAMTILYTDHCWEYYDSHIKEIRHNWRFILFSGLFRREDKVKAILLLTNKNLARWVYRRHRKHESKAA